jgi:DNA-binding transcriptional LysR family regulator
MRDLNDLFFFAQVVEHGGFAKAARALAVPKSRLSRRVAALEARLETRLLQRTTRKLSLTEAGRDYYMHCQTLVAAADAADQAAARRVGEPRGRLRVACAVALAQREVGPVLGEFLRRYPQVRLDLLVSNRRVDLIEEGIDVAVRVRHVGDEDPNLATRRLRRAAACVFAAPSLLKEAGPLDTPEDLQHIPVLDFGGFRDSVTWQLVGPGGAVRKLPVRARLHADDFVAIKHAALDGVGVCLLPPDVVADAVARGQLVRVLPDWSGPVGFVHAVYAAGRNLPPAVRAFVDFLAEKFAPPRAAAPTPRRAWQDRR